MTENYDYLFKIILIGDVNVGKTSLVRRFTSGRFQKDIFKTTCFDFTVKTIKLDGRIIKLQIWDTHGHERFRSYSPAFYRNVNAAMVVYDVTNYESLKNCVRWMNDVKQNSGQDMYIPQILLGNKSDKLSGRVISKSDGERFALQHNMMGFLETSAKDGDVDDAFYKIAQELSRTYMDSMDFKPDSIKLDKLPDNSDSWWARCGY